MNSRNWCFVLCVSLGAVLAAACGDDDQAPAADGGADGAVDAGPDTMPPDAGGGGSPYGPCQSNSDCPEDTFCDREIPSTVSVPGAPSGEISQALFPGGSCSPRPLSPFSNPAACDSSLPQPAQGCGEDGACVLESLSDGTYAGCRAACEPAADSSGCAREGYTCDFGVRACVEGCRADAECRIRASDANGDGELDTLSYDDESRATCDPETARCTHPGPSVPVGSRCERLDDCSPDARCLNGLGVLAGLDFPGGYCTKYGCGVKGRECEGSGTVCESLRPWLGGSPSTSVCLTRCEVGAELPEDRTGVDGHGVGCRPGYRCHYNGGTGADDGVCVGGVYTNVQENNIGAACTRDQDCYSPYGYGTCLQYTATSAAIEAPTGTCSLLDCNAPGIPDGVCGAGNECVLFTGDLTFCIPNCSTAEECAEGYACADEDGDPGTAKVCFPACAGNADCRSDERCQAAAGQQMGAPSFGRCVAMGASGG